MVGFLRDHTKLISEWIYIFKWLPTFYLWTWQPGIQHYLHHLVDHLYGQARCNHIMWKGSQLQADVTFTTTAKEIYFFQRAVQRPVELQNILPSLGGRSLFRVAGQRCRGFVSSMQRLDESSGPVLLHFVPVWTSTEFRPFKAKCFLNRTYLSEGWSESTVHKCSCQESIDCHFTTIPLVVNMLLPEQNSFFSVRQLWGRMTILISNTFQHLSKDPKVFQDQCRFTIPPANPVLDPSWVFLQKCLKCS